MHPSSLRTPATVLAVVTAALFVLATAGLAYLPAAGVARAEGAQPTSAEDAPHEHEPAHALEPVPHAHEHLPHRAAGAASDRTALIEAFTTGFTGGTVPLSEASGEVREFVLEVHEVTREIAPGVEVEQWAFAFPGEEPTVPGPEIRVTQGDLVRITLRNTHDQPHSIHPHGITTVAMEADGVAPTSFHVLPGEAYTYEFVAGEPGTHAYHCHVQTNLHLDMGMYGPIIVEPADDGDRAWDREHVMTLDEWDSRQDPDAAVHVSEPDTFLVNGLAHPLVEPFEVPEGEVALFRITNVGYQPHALHLHGMNFLVIAKDGYDLPQPYRGDTLPVLPGERYDLLVKGRDGTFPFHDHVVDNVTNGGIYPGGMLALIQGGEPRTTRSDPRSVHAGQEARPQPIDGGESPAAPTEAHDVPLQEGSVETRIEGFAFEAPVLRVKKGTTVTWINEDAAPHTVTAGHPGEPPAERAFDSSGEAEGRMEMMEQGEAWSHTFDAAGTFDLYCLPHPFMTAQVIVEE